MDINEPKEALSHPISSYELPTSQAPALIWHARLAHLGKPALEKLEANTTGADLMSNEIPNATNTNPNSASKKICQTCATANLRQQISRVPQTRGSKPFKKIHIDIVFPKPVSTRGFTQFMHAYCDYSRFHVVFPAKDRSEDTIKGNLRQLIKFAKRYKHQIRIIRSDSEGALRSGGLQELFQEHSITYKPTVASTPNQNRIAEASGDILIRKARSIRIQADLPSSLWPDLIQTAAYLDNRTPKNAIGWKTPYKLVFGSQPYLGNIRIIGSKAFILNKAIAPGSKMEARAYVGYLIGYDLRNI
jgi:hypothetical protein